jgi:hypothetical protein
MNLRTEVKDDFFSSLSLSPFADFLACMTEEDLQFPPTDRMAAPAAATCHRYFIATSLVGKWALSELERLPLRCLSKSIPVFNMRSQWKPVGGFVQEGISRYLEI